MTTKNIEISVTMTPAEAEATAQFYKRAGYEDYHRNANHYHTGEMENMMSGGSKIQDALNRAGFNPR